MDLEILLKNNQDLKNYIKVLKEHIKYLESYNECLTNEIDRLNR